MIPQWASIIAYVSQKINLFRFKACGPLLRLAMSRV